MALDFWGPYLQAEQSRKKKTEQMWEPDRGQKTIDGINVFSDLQRTQMMAYADSSCVCHFYSTILLSWLQLEPQLRHGV